MPYTAEISRSNPAAFIFLIDQSLSMEEPFGGGETESSKADLTALTTNRIFQALVARCAKGMDIRRYFQISVIGYGGSVGPALGGELSGRQTVWIDEIAEHFVRMDTVTKKVSDGAGGLVDTTVELPVWLDSTANGGTPMYAAFQQAKSIVADWIEEQPSSFPPILINISDGEYNDSDPTPLVEEIQQMETADGAALVFNIHLSSTRAHPISFPDSEESLPDQFSRILFRMSSLLPSGMRETAHDYGYQTTADSRALIFNAKAEDLAAFLNIGTRASNLR